MSDKNLNIKSSTIEKGLELAKDFLGKLISPAIEEVGLFISDNLKYWRFKNQVNILLKAKEYVDKKNISIKEIPIKILVPLLDSASLEENETLQEKWANMLVNMVNSEKNFESHIFPYILSQISIEEYNELKELILKEDSHRKTEAALVQCKISDQFSFNQRTKNLQAEVDKIEQSGFSLQIEKFEQSNLLRLGLVRQLPPKIYINEFKTGGGHFDSREEWHQIDAKYDPGDYGYRLTELGDKFLEICEIEENKPNFA